jgi:mannonate dehydratase
MNRRKFLLTVSTLGLATAGLSASENWIKPLLLNPCLSGLPENLANHPLMAQIWQGIDASQVWDSHVHLIGSGDSNPDDRQNLPWFSPNMDSYLHPILKIQKYFYLNGSCIEESAIDQSYIARLLELVAGMRPGFKAMLYAFDWYHDAQGQALPEQSIFHIPNSYAKKITQAHPNSFEWVASIHPYRHDCVEALLQVHAAGARAIKWLPSAMGIDPLSKQCERFYQTAADLNIPIISHTGRENAVQGGNQDFGNPLRMRRALDAGVRVVLAHCASEGDDVDLDKGDNAERLKSFELFARLMDEPRYSKLLYADISAITLRNHAWVIASLLQRRDWHSRLLNGSDYPLAAIVPLFNLDKLVSENLLAQEVVPMLNTLLAYNPLLFDFALKRSLLSGTDQFPVSVFETRRFFEV